MFWKPKTPEQKRLDRLAGYRKEFDNHLNSRLSKLGVHDLAFYLRKEDAGITLATLAEVLARERWILFDAIVTAGAITYEGDFAPRHVPTLLKYRKWRAIYLLQLNNAIEPTSNIINILVDEYNSDQNEEKANILANALEKGVQLTSPQWHTLCTRKRWDFIAIACLHGHKFPASLEAEVVAYIEENKAWHLLTIIAKGGYIFSRESLLTYLCQDDIQTYGPALTMLEAGTPSSTEYVDFIDLSLPLARQVIRQLHKL